MEVHICGMSNPMYQSDGMTLVPRRKHQQVSLFSFSQGITIWNTYRWMRQLVRTVYSFVHCVLRMTMDAFATHSHPFDEQTGRYGQDAWLAFHDITDGFTLLGVADGVGGWRVCNIDSGRVSFQLMKYLQQLAKCHTMWRKLGRPHSFIHEAYRQCWFNWDRPHGGATTLTLLSLTKCPSHISVPPTYRLHIFELGDSGVCVFRQDKMVFHSRETYHTHRSHVPQLELAQWNEEVIHKDAHCTILSVQTGDMIVLASDGLWDSLAVSLSSSSSLLSCDQPITDVWTRTHAIYHELFSSGSGVAAASLAQKLYAEAKRQMQRGDNDCRNSQIQHLDDVTIVCARIL